MFLINTDGYIIAISSKITYKDGVYSTFNATYQGDNLQIIDMEFPKNLNPNATLYLNRQFVEVEIPIDEPIFPLKEELGIPQPPELPAPLEPSMKDRLSIIEAKVEANTQSNAFLEDCVAEMAGVVYA